MAHESFEDEQVAQYLNQHYVSIKVDREERPDIDHIYMTYCQAVTGEGGWPLTVIMTPDGHPFFAGTYFPKNARYGRPGLLEILHAMHERWNTQRDKLVSASAQLVSRMQPIFAAMPGEIDGKQAARQAASSLRDRFDTAYGGFTDAPKFPALHQIMFLLRYSRFASDPAAQEMALHTLDAIMKGGIADHVGGGIARYSTDAFWRVPHFEKMLYDNALAVAAYTEAYQVTKEAKYRRFVEHIIGFIERALTSPEGAFYSALDADSEGQEGRFYVWRPEDVMAALGDEDGDLYCAFYDITEEGNFEGYSVPNYVDRDIAAFAAARNMSVHELWRRLDDANRRLYEWREHREHPGLDDKVLTAWNALAISGLAKAGAVFADEHWLGLAVRAAQALERLLVRKPDGRLLARYRDGDANVFAYADDHAYLIAAYLDLYEATLDPFYLRRAQHWQSILDTLFWDADDGGYYLYGRDAERLIAHPKAVYDGATPSANSVSAHNLLRLYALVGDVAYADRLDRLLRAFGAWLMEAPVDHVWLVTAAMLRDVGSTEVVWSAAQGEEDVQTLMATFHPEFLPEAVLLTPDVRPTEQTSYPPAEDKPLIYVCRNFHCERPQEDVAATIVNLVSHPPHLT
ncbi:thioredoxin domain-containing protein [Alicyclobacillus sacchari]|nr:thioredoxin domain-containing protein [Alicyclobacillus sacchari]